MPEKKCSKCGKVGKEYFPTVKARCKECLAKAQRDYRASQAGKKDWEKNGRKYTLKKRYGITQEQYVALLESQNGLCKICGLDPTKFLGTYPTHRRLHVDHDHKSGRVRSLLCNGCNRALGLIQERIGTAESIVKYLKEFSCPT